MSPFTFDMFTKDVCEFITKATKTVAHNFSTTNLKEWFTSEDTSPLSGRNFAIMCGVLAVFLFITTPFASNKIETVTVQDVQSLKELFPSLEDSLARCVNNKLSKEFASLGIERPSFLSKNVQIDPWIDKELFYETCRKMSKDQISFYVEAKTYSWPYKFMSLLLLPFVLVYGWIISILDKPWFNWIPRTLFYWKKVWSYFCIFFCDWWQALDLYLLNHLTPAQYDWYNESFLTEIWLKVDKIGIMQSVEGRGWITEWSERALRRLPRFLNADGTYGPLPYYMDIIGKNVEPQSWDIPLMFPAMAGFALTCFFTYHVIVKLCMKYSIKIHYCLYSWFYRF